MAGRQVANSDGHGPRASSPRYRVEAKLHPPAQRPGTVDRVRLVRMLTAEPGPSNVLMTAPPGYGKTTLLAQWKARERRPVAWLSLDDLDNDPAVLLSYLAVAFDRIESIDDKIRIALAAPRQRILATASVRLSQGGMRCSKDASALFYGSLFFF